METKEKLLLKNLRRGDRFTFEYLYKTYYQKLFRLSNTILKDNQLAREIVNDVFLYLWEKRKDIEIKKNLEAFLVVKTKSLSLNALRKKIKQLHVSDTELELLNEEIHNFQDDTALSGLISNDLQRKFNLLLDQLPEQQKKIYNLSRIEGLSAKEIAEKTSLSFRTVETHLLQALKKIREQINVIFD